MMFSDGLFQASGSAEEFMLQLPRYDQNMAERRQEAEAAGEVSISSPHY